MGQWLPFLYLSFPPTPFNEDPMADQIRVEVAFALPDRQQVIALRVNKGTTLYEAALQSGITDQFSGLDLEQAPMGIFGKVERRPKERVLEEGDRVEIYRPLTADPMVVRKQRAAAKLDDED
jgi:putative ubiquitin-RnfH superfamily antitoxin RatB of RatAB toxin-antitoxin module